MSKKKKLSSKEKSNRRIKSLTNELVATVDNYSAKNDELSLAEITSSLLKCLKGINKIQIEKQ